MILIIDNYDSFTYNLMQRVEGLGASTQVVLHDKISIDDITNLNPDKIIISPGPGKPENAGISKEVVKQFYTKIPLLGVCLGHQCIGEVFGSKIIPAKHMMHGKTDEIEHNESLLFDTISNPMTVARYHSLVLDSVPNGFRLSAWDSQNDIMAMQHESLPVFGIQFHPESFLTPTGDDLLRNFVNI